MIIEKNGLWYYKNKWKKLFEQEHELIWQNDWLRNTWCENCRFCCGPQDSDKPFPMALLPEQTGPDLEDKFYLLDASTAYLGKKGCKSETPHGCKLNLREKPVACGLFPIVLANGRLYLYLNCPAVLANPPAIFMDISLKAAEMLQKYSLEELRHLSLDIEAHELSQKYIDMHIEIFNNNEKTIKLD